MPEQQSQQTEPLAPFVNLPGEVFDPNTGMVLAEYPIPDINAIKALDAADRLQLAQAYDFYPSDAQYQEDVAQYVARFSRSPSTLANQPAEVARLTDPMKSNRASLGLARRAQRNYQQRAAMNGNPQQRLFWLCEDDANSCPGCLARQGAEGTMAEHEAAGKPGSRQCGENCRCELMAIDSKPDASFLASGAAAEKLISEVLGMVPGGVSPPAGP